jgi:hypothetical protein
VVVASGDETIRTSVYDIVRQRASPEGYTERHLKNEFLEEWHGQEEKLKALRAEELAKVEVASRVGDYDVANVTVGESIGMIHDLPTQAIVRRVVDEAVGNLDRIRGLTVLDTTLRQATVQLLSFDADVTGRPSTKPWITLMLVSLATTSSSASGTNDIVMGYPP